VIFVNTVSQDLEKARISNFVERSVYKFGVCSFSRFGKHIDATKCFTPATVVGVRYYTTFI